ncbi:hypothetical protein PROFUN_13983 [Planoprotostelium fungivorum]|uniref:Uncharacterized protein n=1 Tax=Planoprotostelium fungivorum TaxID=1890364 RepID=A0A2P6N2P8_9EUKA|nr:hypothetical protein PROFUN_13983 [Planoprotostelium fungivorum]
MDGPGSRHLLHMSPGALSDVQVPPEVPTWSVRSQNLRVDRAL